MASSFLFFPHSHRLDPMPRNWVDVGKLAVHLAGDQKNRLESLADWFCTWPKPIPDDLEGNDGKSVLVPSLAPLLIHLEGQMWVLLGEVDEFLQCCLGLACVGVLGLARKATSGIPGLDLVLGQELGLLAPESQPNWGLVFPHDDRFDAAVLEFLWIGHELAQAGMVA